MVVITQDMIKQFLILMEPSQLISLSLNHISINHFPFLNIIQSVVAADDPLKIAFQVSFFLLCLYFNSDPLFIFISLSDLLHHTLFSFSICYSHFQCFIFIRLPMFFYTISRCFFLMFLVYVCNLASSNPKSAL